MSEFKIAERDFDPRDYEPLSEEWDEEQAEALRKERAIERERIIADSINDAMRDIFRSEL